MIPMNEMNTLTRGELMSKYGSEEIRNTINLIQQLGPAEYSKKYGGFEKTSTASERGAAVPYDEQSGLFSLKNLGALFQNLPGNAVDTYKGVANMATSPVDSFNAIFSEEGFNAIAADIKHQIANPGQTIVERPLETFLNLLPAARVAGAGARASGLTSTITKGLTQGINQFPTLAKGASYASKAAPVAGKAVKAVELAGDPLAAMTKVGAKTLHGVLRVAEEAGFKLPASAASGLSYKSIDRLTKIAENIEGERGGIGSLTKTQETAALPASEAFKTLSGTATRAKQILAPDRAFKTPSKLRVFRDVLSGVTDERAVLDDIMASLTEVDGSITAKYSQDFPDVIDTSNPLEIGDSISSFVSALRQKGIKVIDKYEFSDKNAMARNPNYKPVDKPAGVSETEFAEARGVQPQEPLQNVSLKYRKISIPDFEGSDLSTAERAGFAQDINNAVEEVNNYSRKSPGGVASPQDVYRLYSNIQNLVDIPKKGADVVDTVLLSLRQGLREKLGDLDGKTLSGKTFNEVMTEVESKINFAKDVRREYGLYKNEESNAGSVLRKIARGSKAGDEYRAMLTQNLGDRGPDITTAIEAMEFRGWEPKGLVGRQIFMNIPLMAYAGLAITPWSLLGIPFASPKVVGHFASTIGVSKRATRFLSEMVDEMHKYPTVREMAKNGYTIGGILLNHGRLVDEARQQEKIGGK